MNKAIIKRVAKKSRITWHPMTKKLHKTYIQSHDEAYLRRIVEMFKDSQSMNPQVVYLTSNRTEINEKNKHKSKSEKYNIDYKIIAGVFNPWFDIDVLKHGQMLTAIEISPENNQSKKAFEEELKQLIMLDFLKSISQANIKAMGNNFFELRDLMNGNPEVANAYTELMGQKIGANQFAEYFGRRRDFVYKSDKK